MKTTTSVWSPESRTLRTTLEGVVSEEDVEAWRASLRTAMPAVPAGATALYDAQIAKPNQRFFSDPDDAARWLAEWPFQCRSYGNERGRAPVRHRTTAHFGSQVFRWNLTSSGVVTD